MKQKMLFIALVVFGSACMQLIAAEQPGMTETVFNRRFIPTLKPQMTLEQIVKMAGAPGVKVNENKSASPPIVKYSWKGGRNSVLLVRFSNNKMLDATVLAPNGHTYAIRGSGEVVEDPK